MKFLCDVHISYKVVNHLISLGYEAIHINEVLNKWYTKDNEICRFADANNLIVITKDSDFRDSYFVKGTPKKLIKINLGNISNAELIKILSESIASIQRLDNEISFLIEVEKNYITFITK
jgi:predicted nuclease of predicted toxin-antitoxin system